METSKHLHIIAFDCPYPAHYGGIIDIWYKIIALHRLGIEVTLHVFLYRDKTPQIEINKYCKNVFYYNRNTKLWKHLSNIPYIVNSRISLELVRHIVADPAPVLMEGLHSTASLLALKAHGIPCFIRMHNIEEKYYKYLYTLEENNYKKAYYYLEYKKIRLYEKNINQSSGLIFLSPKDEKSVSLEIKKTTIYPFHGMNIVNQNAQILRILFHANFEIKENRIAAEKIISMADIICLPIIFAGKNADTLPVPILNTKIQFINNPSDEEMLKLLHCSAIHLLPQSQPTGIKLKLIQSLFSAKYIITSTEMASDFPWETNVIVYETLSSIPKIVKDIFEGKINPKHKNNLLLTLDDNQNAQKLWNFIIENS